MEAPPAKFRRKRCGKPPTRKPSQSKKAHMNSTTTAITTHDPGGDSGSDEQQTSSSKYRPRGNMNGVFTLYATITENDEIKKCIDKTGWTQFLFDNVKTSDQKFLPALANRWSPKIHTFQLSNVELGITPFDFTSLTGIAVGMGTKLPPYADLGVSDLSVTVNSYIPSYNQFQPDNCGFGGGLRVSGLRKYITHIYNGGNLLVSVEVISRAFCMYMLGYLFFPNGRGTIGVGWLNYLKVMDEVGTYDWGTAILARIYSGLNRYKQDGMNSLYCFWQLVQFYLFEYLSMSGPKLVNKSDQSWPRMLRWRKDNRKSAPDSFKYNGFAAEKQLEVVSPQSIPWTAFLPFKDKFPYVTEAYNVSLTRHMLMDPQWGAFWYLGERCLRQLTGLIAIPVDPPIPMTISDPASYLQFLNMNTEELRFDKLSRQASQCEYDAYYSNLVNTDVVGNVATHMPEIVLPTVSSALVTVADDHDQSSRLGQSILSIDELMPDWLLPSLGSSGNVTMIPAPRPTTSFEAPSVTSYPPQQWRKVYVEYVDYSSILWQTIVDKEQQLRQLTLQMEQNNLVIKERDAEIERLRQAQNQSKEAESTRKGPNDGS